ncbi:hypothetical protein GOQ29_04285 [Clostridium sp. D2Q-14]|uniref:hypothetical protein n=1 Tax=Anaeromonas gelatinilytica TaxID=2683194 RepID=UPI00193BC1C4|nr:hypothetical protein [Anaeromonas gelatinilytica]MBS4534831.1 hypothetical protein [Anaeromonas gelatinilytica]
MESNKTQCNGCGRNCFITLHKEDNKYYIEGNTCVGGEEHSKKTWDFLKEEDFLKKKEKKKGLFRSLFKK